MPAKAPRIPDEIWDQHREEIVAFYLAPNSLDRTMVYMKENYDFRASKNQYTRKLGSWGVWKYVPGSIWPGVVSVKRKRSQEGKDSVFAFHGRKYSRQKLDKEIARHVSSTRKWCSSENVLLPDYITVSTPPAESSGISREFLLRNLPWYQYTQEIQTLVSRGRQRGITHSTPDISLELATKELSSQSDSDLPQLCVISNFRFQHSSELHTYLPPEDLETRSSSTAKLGTPRKKSPFSDLQVFLRRFIFLSTNNLLYESQFNRVCDLIVCKGGADILVFLCRLGSPSMKVFARKVLCSAVESGNIRLASRVIQCGAQLQDDPSQSQRWAEYLSSAVYHGHGAMVELLCKAGVPPKVKSRWSWRNTSFWESRLPILHTFLAFGADPETFIIDEEPGFPLIDAARNDCLPAVKLLLDAGARVDRCLPQYCGTALQAAASRGHLEVAAYLIQSGADVNVPSVQLLRHHRWNFIPEDMIPFQTPVQLATKVNNLALLQILLDHGASARACPVSTRPDFEHYHRYQAKDFNVHKPRHYPPRYDSECSVYTALQYGVLSQNLNIVALLLSMGVAPDSRVAPGVGDTPLQMSARLSNFEMFQLLLSSGADINAPPAAFNGRNAFQGAAESGNWEILTMLQSAGAQINAPAGAKLGMTALQAACLNGHSLIAGFLLAHRAYLNAAPSSVAGLTPIQAAATYGDIGLARDLISLGADVDAPATEMGTTALLAATKHKSLPLLKILVHHDANVNPTRDCELRSPLSEAARRDWFEGVEFLLKHGANVNDTPFELATSDEYVDSISELLSPLGCAIYNDSEETVDLLLQHGADVLTTAIFDGIDFQSTLAYALRRGSSLDIINLLLAKVQDLEKHPGWEDALKYALRDLDHVEIDVCEVIIEKISSLPPPQRYNAIQKGWDTLPAYCSDDNEDNLLEVIELLIKSGIDVDFRTENGSTLLQRIAGKGYHKSCCFLLDHGATVNTHACQWYGTPLQEAIKMRNVKIADHLLEHGADVNALPADVWGVTAIQAASINGMFEMTVRLLECGADVSAPAAPKDGRTAIDGAAERGHLEMVQLLLNAYGEQEDLRLICSQAADYAEKNDHCEIAQWLRGYV